MKKICFISMFILMGFIVYAQDECSMVRKDTSGRIKYVKYSLADKKIKSPETAKDFFRELLKVNSSDEFRQTKTNNFIPNVRFERYQQFYKGIKVADAHYTFEYKDGIMRKAHGNYISVADMDTTPKLSMDEAKNIYASSFNINIRDTTYSSVELLIKEFPEKKWLGLVYKVFMATPKMMNADIAYIDAQTGEILSKETSFYTYSTGTFHTFYHGIKNGVTEWDSNNSCYKLYESLRGYGIHTQMYSGGYYYEITDNDNTWTVNEIQFYNGNMAYDVHWTMEQIYEALINSYGQNSYDGSGGIIQSSCTSSVDTQYSPANNRFYFNNAYSYQGMGPMASVDVIGHEFGHSILHWTTGWNSVNTYEKLALHEGFADIWGIIMEYLITPYADIWKTGEELWTGTYSCERNFANPSDANAHTQISSTYNINAIISDPHLGGGIAPYWFYLLVNSANLYDAQLLVAYAILHPCLEDCVSFSEVREELIDVALNYMNSSTLATKVADAWDAVGVGSPDLSRMMQCDPNMTDDINYRLDITNAGVSYEFTVRRSADLSEVSSWNLTIANIETGQIVYESNGKNKKTVDSSKWKKGVYVATATLNEKNVSRKFII